MPRLPAFPLLLLLSISSAQALRLCSFNVRSFGEAKKENKNAMDVIMKVRPPSWSQRALDPPHALSLPLDFKRLGRNFTQVSL